MPKYYASIADETNVIKSRSLTSLISKKNKVVHLFEEQLHHTRFFYHNIDEFKYRIININGNETQIDLRSFAILEIGVDDKVQNGTFRNILVRENQTSKTQSISTYTQYWRFDDFINITLKKLIEDLEAVDSLIAYNLLIENRRLKSKNDELLEELKKFKSSE